MALKKKQKKEKQKPGRKKRLVRLITTTGILAGVLIFLFLFKVDNIIVTGNERYSDEEIKSLVINEDSFNNTLLFCLVNHTIQIEDVPLLESIEVAYVDRNTISLKANEKLTIGMFPVGDKVCCIDQDGIVIEILDYADSSGLNLPLIYNLCTSGTVGEKIEIEDESVLNTLHAMMSSFKRYEIMPESIEIVDESDSSGTDNADDAKETDNTDSGDNTDGTEGTTVKTYTLSFGDKTVLLGRDELLEEKMQRLAAIMPHLAGKSGTLHLENYNEDTENIIFDTNTTE